jgi:hypothetical protein
LRIGPIQTASLVQTNIETYNTSAFIRIWYEETIFKTHLKTGTIPEWFIEISFPFSKDESHSISNDDISRKKH